MSKVREIGGELAIEVELIIEIYFFSMSYHIDNTIYSLLINSKELNIGHYATFYFESKFIQNVIVKIHLIINEWMKERRDTIKK